MGRNLLFSTSLTDGYDQREDQPMKNIVLIGMPGAGKSTLGPLLARTLNRDFIDTDLLIQEKTGLPLQEIIDTQGLEAFKRIEEATMSATTSIMLSSLLEAAWYTISGRWSTSAGMA
jgi:thymidylate kinase